MFLYMLRVVVSARVSERVLFVWLAGVREREFHYVSNKS